MSCCLECGSVWSSRYGKNSRSPWLIDAVSAPGGQTRITQSSGPSLIVFIVGPEQKPDFDELPVYG